MGVQDSPDVAIFDESRNFVVFSQLNFVDAFPQLRRNEL
jgi:hypothetical protein